MLKGNDTMLTVAVYVVVTLVIAAALFALSLVVFGRSEALPAVEKGHTITSLPQGPIEGDDLRAVCFGMAARGYRMDEVDWALEQAAREIDDLRARLGEPDPAGAPARQSDGRPATASG